MKKILIICSFIFLLLFVGVFLLSLADKVKPGLFFKTAPTPTPISISTQENNTGEKNNPTIISVSPQDKTTQVSTQTPIHIVFSKPLNPNTTFFSISPNSAANISISNNTVTIAPTAGWDEATTYVYFIYFSSSTTQTLSFTTQGVTPGVSPILGDNGSEHAVLQEKQQHPDIFLSNYTPYNNDLFSVTSDVSSSVNGHFYFLVALTGDDPHASLQAFYAWLTSLSLSQAQIQSLDIRFNQNDSSTSPQTIPPNFEDNPPQ